MDLISFRNEAHDQHMSLHDVHAALHTLMTDLDPSTAEWQKLYRVQRSVSVAIDEMRDMLNPPKSAFPTVEEQSWLDQRAAQAKAAADSDEVYQDAKPTDQD